MNNSSCIGNIATDLELRTTNSGKSVVNFRLAINEGKDRPATFITVVAFDRQAEILCEYAAKGSKIGVDGRLTNNNWTTEAGEKRSVVELIANRIHLLGTKRDAEEAPEADVPTEAAELAVV